MENYSALLADITAVLNKHCASLFFSAPATLWVDGGRVGEVWNTEGGDGSELEFVDPAKAAGGAP